MTHHERFMLEALDEARAAADGDEIPVGAVVVRDGVVVARAHNETVRAGDPTAHAEVLALRRAFEALGNGRLYGCALYVTLEPCPMCAGAIVLARLGQLYFGAFDEKAGAAGTLFSITTDPRLNHRVVTNGGILDDECGALLRAFFADRRDASSRGVAGNHRSST